MVTCRRIGRPSGAKRLHGGQQRGADIGLTICNKVVERYGERHYCPANAKFDAGK